MLDQHDCGIWLVRPDSEALALVLQQRLGGAIYRPWLIKDEQPVAQKQQFAEAYRRHPQWIVIAASGIAVRFLDGLPQDKHSDPAVVVLDEAGRFAVSLLAGHEGGANRLAYRVANVTGAMPIVTTATEALKPLVVGIGCRKGASVEQITAAVKLALSERQLNEVREMATIDLKADEPGLLAFCEQNDLPLRVLASSAVAARPWVTKASDWVQQIVGLPGVCEPCALIANPRGKLIVPKTALNGVAVAVVEDMGWHV
ncbi:cobalamin biosynthesis protein [Candidatus Methylobacter oryzae]|uniref:Cobalamin biosynthesis protein CbiG n=1 Tax=Candidatus Methylobacter oryzae TaxID=2497749 RepID=A0ABY3CF84_9GAMM|nr:cobalamin biosynthesis protein [Candidatus Methylobacter oryzae]TRX02105.1 cobalamin biosynthesis protein CbiG [Candidatus Methylobacter oryzae]